VVTFGLRRPADVSAQNVHGHGDEGSSFDLVVEGVREPATLPLAGEHNIYSALAATAAALEWGITPSQATTALARFQPE
jgi:UDP-N-acetylmuramoyl-tripeptide--D-alanyl-D-alanine ligase